MYEKKFVFMHILSNRIMDIINTGDLLMKGIKRPSIWNWNASKLNNLRNLMKLSESGNRNNSFNAKLFSDLVFSQKSRFSNPARVSNKHNIDIHVSDLPPNSLIFRPNEGIHRNANIYLCSYGNNDNLLTSARSKSTITSLEKDSEKDTDNIESSSLALLDIVY